MGKAKVMTEKLKKLSEREGVIGTWDRSSGAGTINSGTQAFEVKPELVKSAFEDREAVEGLEVDFEVGSVDGKEMVTSVNLKK